ncbi:Inorganic pyrophosphatase 2 [Morus notabilis]|uniref:Inorganic pyrophosphatase 2 n=1 Tax=Morus notabilis TaxID=981085 RepID=W9SJD1_9ROSA|nr:inorganic pyrophosphatase 1 [Morus notabilis]EXC11128.1 Inorganic pyrophosphatase 2 [Morus notabilis]
MDRIVVVFDFDKTIIECDCENLVVDELGATDLFNQLLPTMTWNSLMNRMMKELHEQGKTIEDIVEVLKQTPIHPRVVAAIKAAHALGCDLRIVSDANAFFIETILEHLGLMECFTEIYTNPSFVDEEGRLRIFPFHVNKCPLGWNLCPPNMCKGLILERIRASMAAEGNKRFIYLGDGVGDYCPSLKLKGRDFVMPRKNFPVWELISKNPQLIKANIQAWTDGEELEKTLLSLIDTIFIEENASLIITRFDN